MEKLLRLAHLDLEIKKSKKRKCGENAPDKLRILVNCVSHNVHEYIEKCTDYDSAISVLEKLNVKTPNKIFARHLLAIRQQKSGESLDEFMKELSKLGEDCNLKAVGVEQYKEELIRDAFTNGLTSPLNRQRLLENKTLDEQATYDQAYSLDLTQRNASSYSSITPQFVHTAAVVTPDHAQTPWDDTVKNKPMPEDCVTMAEDQVPAPTGKTPTATIFDSSQLSVLATISGTSFPQSLHLVATSKTINWQKLMTLVDSCSDDRYIDEEVAWDLKLPIYRIDTDVTLAQKSLHTNSHGYVEVDLTLYLNGQTYPSTRLLLIKYLCCGVLLGQDFQKQHQCVVIEYGGPKTTFKLPDTNLYCSLATVAVDEPSLFQHLSPNCKPIVTKSRYYGKDDKELIEMETNCLLAEGIIENSLSPWRAQFVVVKDPMNRHKKRMHVDYSQTVNLYTELDAYPLPRIYTMVNELSTYHVFSTFDLKSAYHQIPLKESDKKYTAFEAIGLQY
ncbi:uncharacterized protein LOC143037735 [Oratosquilla oratoria]|uniref:uncharacterized protein LOC143037735 n=1 Tax=Oratosquilla oratoria TaxID=337810 RepID=UPI003F7733A5